VLRRKVSAIVHLYCLVISDLSVSTHISSHKEKDGKERPLGTEKFVLVMLLVSCLLV
jgi:hypothetical protein